MKTTLGLSTQQLENGTPSDRVLVLKAFYKGDKCTLSPVKDMNGRYRGIQENIPESKKLEMGYVPHVESKVKIYDDITIDLNSREWAADWEWMKHCNEIADDFASGQASPGAYFYIYRPGFESAKKVTEAENKVKLMNYVLTDSAENLYNRASILGIDMGSQALSDVKEYLLSMIETEPSRLKAVYESKTFSLELLLMHAIKERVILRRNGVYTFGEILLGVDKKSVVTFFANPGNHVTTKAIEAVTYGVGKKKNPLEDESVSATDDDSFIEAEGSAPDQPVDGKQAGVMMSGLLITKDTPIEGLSPIQKATRTRLKNAANKEKKD